MPILKLHQPDENKEIEFELSFLLSLSTKQRFQMMLKKSEEIRKLQKNYHERRKTSQIIKRTS